MGKLTDSVFSGDLTTLKTLLSQSASLEEIDGDGRTPLIHSAIEGKTEIAAALIQAGANAGVQDNLGNSALHYAAQGFHTQLAKLLINAGANINAQDILGNTPLWRAVFSSKGRGEMIELFLSSGADPNYRNRRGKSPRELAKTITNYDILQYFAKK
jgi:ankyrin repeat protein